MTGLIHQMSESAALQSRAVVDIQQRVETINDIGQQTREGARQTAESTHQLGLQASALKQLVDEFQY